MDLNTITFFPSSFFNSMTTIQHKKLTITININFKQLKSTKCFKYIKCSISNSLVEKMLARLNREAVCNNHLLLCTKLMKLSLCDICVTYGCYNALNDSKCILLFHDWIKDQESETRDTMHFFLILIPNLLAVGWMREAVRQKHAQTCKRSSSILSQ